MELEWRDNMQGSDWQAMSDLYRIAPLGEKTPHDLKTVFSASRYKVFVYHNNAIIGVGRALADGADCSYICDVAVHPDFQAKGIGRQIIEKLIEKSRGHKKIILYAFSGKEGFYKKLGFSKMTTAMAIFADHDQAVEWDLIESE